MGEHQEVIGRATFFGIRPPREHRQPGLNTQTLETWQATEASVSKQEKLRATDTVPASRLEMVLLHLHYV